jgi:hypothetical protein
MDAEAAKLLETFVKAANWDMLNASDWERFFDFVLDIERRGIHIGDDEVRKKLEEMKFPERHIAKAITLFNQSRHLLSYARRKGHGLTTTPHDRPEPAHPV